jgi:uncharacterized repeat protein (TIGR04138 family)
MPESEFADIVARITKADPRFDRKAYEFVRLGLDHTVKDLRKKDGARAERARHVSGAELLGGLRTYALDQFGPMAKSILNSWGIASCRDFGSIVFNLIEYKVFSKTESDRLEDFDGLYDFDAAFVAPFLPARRTRGTSTAESVGSA